MTIPRGPQPFIRRVHLTGDFGINEVTFTRHKTQPGASEKLLTRTTEGLFAKGNGKGEILLVKLTGTYDDASYGPTNNLQN
jgi:hypothetical protein